MMGTLFFPFGHFPFDDSGVDAIAAGADVFLTHFAQQGFVPGRERLLGAAVAFGEAALQDLQATGERQAVHVPLRGASRFEHQGADHEVAQRQGIHFLSDSLGCFATQVRGLFGAARVLVRFLFVVRQFHFPAFVVQQDQFPRGKLLLVQKVPGPFRHVFLFPSD